jgi:hypothetical protein
MYYIFIVGEKYIKVNPKTLAIGLTADITKAAVWDSKKLARSWEASIKAKYCDAKMKNANINIV